MLKLTSMPAGEGDALWVEWGSEKTHRMIIDMGRAAHGKKIREMLKDLSEEERVVDLLIVTHVDRDHIEGVISGFAAQEEASGTTFKSIWFNGWNHLHGLHFEDPPPPFDEEERNQIVADDVQTFGAVQGELLTPWAANSGVWNSHFDGNPVIRPENDIGQKIELDGGLVITILGPTQSILNKFIDRWGDEIVELEKDVALENYTEQRVGEGVNTFGRERPTKPVLESLEELQELAKDGEDERDKSPANGSSICIIIEYQGYRLLLTGDAHSDNLIEALDLLPSEEAKFDLVKLPHHGSMKNVTAELMEKLDCNSFLISTSGSYYYHPDAAAIARIVTGSMYEAPAILFNVPSEFNGWWDNQEWASAFGYEVAYGDEDEGLTLFYGQVG